MNLHQGNNKALTYDLPWFTDNLGNFGQRNEMTWKQDRVYVFLETALSYNTDEFAHFYFDRADRLFFRLFKDNATVGMSPKNSLAISEEKKMLLTNKIEKVKRHSSDLLEIHPLKKRIVDPDRGKTAKNMQDYNRRFAIGKDLAEKVSQFLENHHIDLETADVIEY